MKKTALAMATAAILTSSFALAGGHAKSVKLGVVLGFTGPAESLAESMARGAELAMKEVSASKLLLDSATAVTSEQIRLASMPQPQLPPQNE